MKNDISPLVEDFCKFAYLQNNYDAETPNVHTSMSQVMGNGDIMEWVKNWDFHDWDTIDDPMTVISPQFLAYILLASKAYWESKNGRA